MGSVAQHSCYVMVAFETGDTSARGWREGTFLPAIFQTAIYGHRRLGRLLSVRPALSSMLSRAVIAWECSFPLVLVAPPSVVAPVLLMGVAFHAVNAYLMGLNTFFWSFAATYPAILYCSHHRPW